MIKPLLDKVVLKMVETEEVTESGIILTGIVKETPQIATVIAVGPGGIVNGNEVVMQVSVNDKVIINKHAGTEVKLENEDYIIVCQDDILGIIL